MSCGRLLSASVSMFVGLKMAMTSLSAMTSTGALAAAAAAASVATWCSVFSALASVQAERGSSALLILQPATDRPSHFNIHVGCSNPSESKRSLFRKSVVYVLSTNLAALVTVSYLGSTPRSERNVLTENRFESRFCEM